MLSKSCSKAWWSPQAFTAVKYAGHYRLLLHAYLLCMVLQKQDLGTNLSSSISGAFKHDDEGEVELTFADKASCL